MTSRTPTEPDLHPLSEEEKAVYRARLRSSLFRKLRAIYRRRKKAWGWTQKDLAKRLNTDPAVVSRRMKGNDNVTLDWICDFARAMDARVDVSITPLSEVRKRQVQTGVWADAARPGPRHGVQVAAARPQMTHHLWTSSSIADASEARPH